MDKQEMFNRAWTGLKNQNWEPSVGEGGCKYNSGNGVRCAWGHVDAENASLLHRYEGYSVDGLHDHGIGLASELSRDDLRFAMSLQRCHDIVAENDTDVIYLYSIEKDFVNIGRDMEANFRALAKLYGLTIPE